MTLRVKTHQFAYCDADPRQPGCLSGPTGESNIWEFEGNEVEADLALIGFGWTVNVKPDFKNEHICPVCAPAGL